MKKLLALILCVMMFVSVIPTMAFATDGNTDKDAAAAGATYKATKEATKKDLNVDNPFKTASQYKKEIENMIKHTKESIETAYGVLAMDQGVYGAAKGMDDVIVNLVDAIANPLVEDGKMTSAAVKTVKNNIRALMGAAIAEDMSKTYKYTNADGEIDPAKYLKTFSKAVSDALTDKDFIAGYQDVATYFALSKMVKDLNDKLEDEYDAFAESVDATFDKTTINAYGEEFAKYVESFTALGTGNPATAYPWAAEVYAVVGAES